MTIDEVAAKVRDYVDGVSHRDADLLRASFDESAQIIGIDEGRRVVVPRDRWIAFVCAAERVGWGSPLFEIESIDLVGSAAVARVRTRYGKFAYADILTLIQVPGSEPRIMSKTFHQIS